MGVTPDLQEGVLKTGDVVVVRQGKNKGKFFVVVGIESETRVFISDGSKYPVGKPKKEREAPSKDTNESRRCGWACCWWETPGQRLVGTEGFRDSGYSDTSWRQGG